MASMLPVVLFECGGQAPAPSKDFYHLLVTREEIILRYWKISLRSGYQGAKPGEFKESHQDFVDDRKLQSQIASIFGQNILKYVINLCHGYYDYLERLSKPLLFYILTFLDLEDIARLSQVSHMFQKICNSDHLWEHIVESSCDKVTPEMKSLAQDIGWKQLFFTNKLQLQLQLRRRRQADERGNGFPLE
ncbi:hypothetical protein GDO86_010314 [Hymenochirus boettgeri]|uniref:F-box domain-containing protein n=1 Tax=Hymenochirus boettgeri TaxID=247094 RepID=A0A8T2JSJ1_9PIPI|nr:hypothetical protein GDO86_010314 [Hymenochirus boettgeri]